MDELLAFGETSLRTLGWLVCLGATLGLLGRLAPCNPGMYWWTDLRAVAADLVYWFIVPVFTRFGRLVLLILGVALLFGGRDPDLLPVRQRPLWLQCAAILVLQDVLLYWLHRAFHTRPAWRFHAIHHSPVVLDWMSSGRNHPINTLLSVSLADVAVLLLGFAPEAIFALAPFQVAYSAFVHANLNWTFGPFRYVLASPVFHRWHHTTRAEGLDTNFAPTFPLLDVLFGTFHMPPGRLPEEYGSGDPALPMGFWGQLLYPFRGRAVSPAPESTEERPRRAA